MLRDQHTVGFMLLGRDCVKAQRKPRFPQTWGPLNEEPVTSAYSLNISCSMSLIFRAIFGEHPGDHHHQDFPKSAAMQIMEAHCDTNGRRTVIQMGGVLTVFPFLRA